MHRAAVQSPVGALCRRGRPRCRVLDPSETGRRLADTGRESIAPGLERLRRHRRRPLCGRRFPQSGHLLAQLPHPGQQFLDHCRIDAARRPLVRQARQEVRRASSALAVSFSQPTFSPVSPWSSTKWGGPWVSRTSTRVGSGESPGSRKGDRAWDPGRVKRRRLTSPASNIIKVLSRRSASNLRAKQQPRFIKIDEMSAALEAGKHPARRRLG